MDSKQPVDVNHGSDRDVCFMSAQELLASYARKEFSPLDVMTSVFDRIDAVNPTVNALVTLVRDEALIAAREATEALEKNNKLSPLHGVPVSIKDLTPTKGIRTTWGSKIFADHVPEADALIVERLKNAGAIIIGKSNTPEFGAGGHTFNDVFGPTRNPWDLTKSAGGSSGGAAAAVATGMGPLAQGSDLGGSLRTPATFCGVVGFRGSPGLVPAYPTPLAWQGLAAQGPISRTVGDIALMLSVIAGRDDRDPLSYEVAPERFVEATLTESLEGWKIAWSPDLDGLVPVEEEVIQVAGSSIEVFRELGATVENACPGFGELEDVVLGTRGLSMVASYAKYLEKFRDVMQDGLVWNIEQGLALTVIDIARAEIGRTTLWSRVRQFMQKFDLLILPGTAISPFPIEWSYPEQIAGKKLKNYMEWFYLTYAISVAALPVISVPCGFNRNGLPIGIQIVGGPRQEARVLAAAAVFERARPWRQLRPNVLSALPRP